MSFAEQERALFDLLFDRDIRENFCRSSVAALAPYDLSDQELADFKEIRTDAMELDASMRAYLILTQICRQLPMTFALAASLDGGVDVLKRLVNVKTMTCDPLERVAVFGCQLQEYLGGLRFDVEKEQAIITAILEAELALVWTATMLRRQALAGHHFAGNTGVMLPADWTDQPIKLAAYVSVSLLPLPYAELKSGLCPCEDEALWARLTKAQMTAGARRGLFAGEQPKLFIARAYISRFSRFDPVVDYQTVELSEGFATLFQYINDGASAGRILAGLAAAGMAGHQLAGVRSGFEQLLAHGMLEFV